MISANLLYLNFIKECGIRNVNWMGTWLNGRQHLITPKGENKVRKIFLNITTNKMS